ncbi:MAG: monooxygenase, partial [Actinomycetota bacterium]
VSKAAEAAYVAEIVERGGQTDEFSSNCTPGYYNNEGRPELADDQLGRLGYPEGPVAYFAYIDAWRSSGEFAGLEFRD